MERNLFDLNPDPVITFDKEGQDLLYSSNEQHRVAAVLYICMKRNKRVG